MSRFLPSKTGRDLQEGLLLQARSLLATSNRMIWFVVTFIRFIIVFRLLPMEITNYIQKPALRSVLMNPELTLHQIREAVAIRNLIAPHRFVDAYAGLRVRGIPALLLVVMQGIVYQKNSSSIYWQEVFIGLLVIVVDLCIASNLERFYRLNIRYQHQHAHQHSEDTLKFSEISLEELMPLSIQSRLSHIFPVSLQPKSAIDQGNTTTSLLHITNLPFLVAFLYYASPITILASSSYGCFQNFSLLLLTASLNESFELSGSAVWASFCLATSSYLDPHNVIFIIPIALLAQQSRKSAAVTVISFLSISSFLQWLSFLLVGPDQYLSVIDITHGSSFRLKGLCPSLSTLWYLSMEMFERFQSYFQILLGTLPYLLVIPTAVRLYRYPLVQVAVFWLLGTLFRPPGTLYNLNVALVLLLFSPRSLARMSPALSLVSLCATIVPVTIYFVTYWLWLETGSGEANFCYFQILAYNVFVAIILLQFVSASVKRDKALRLTANAYLVAKKEN